MPVTLLCCSVHILHMDILLYSCSHICHPWCPQAGKSFIFSVSVSLSPILSKLTPLRKPSKVSPSTLALPTTYPLTSILFLCKCDSLCLHRGPLASSFLGNVTPLVFLSLCSSDWNASLCLALPLSISTQCLPGFCSCYPSSLPSFIASLQHSVPIRMLPFVDFSFLSEAVPSLTFSPQLLNQSPQAEVPISSLF